MTPTKTRSFDIIVATSATDDTPRVAETIEVEVYPGETPEDDFLTPESTELIEERRAFHMGRLLGKDITLLRKKFNLTQGQLATCIKCAEKSLSRWENGRGFPSEMVNTLLRLLEDGKVTPETLLSIQGPRRKDFQEVFFDRRAPADQREKIIPWDFSNSESDQSPEQNLETNEALLAL